MRMDTAVIPLVQAQAAVPMTTINPMIAKMNKALTNINDFN